ncbi:SCO6880 family protein [Kocuria rhizophila]|uniref:SCO6880 family protein n=1 Tax=Kocuria rhizophila TaxID=72000 RepID=UPI003879B646
MSEQMTESRTELAEVQFPRSGGNHAVLWLDRSQLIGAGAVMVVLMVVLVLAMGANGFGNWWVTGGLLVVLLMVVVVIIVPVAGRPLPWWIAQVVRGRVRERRGQNEFVSRAASKREEDSDDADEEAALQAGVQPPARLRLPGEGAELRVYTLTRGACVVWDPVAKTATMIARVHPQGFRMAEPEDQADVLESYSSMLDALHNEDGVVAVQVSDMVTTASASQIREAYLRQVETARVAGVSAGPDQSAVLHQDYLQLLTGDRAQVQHDHLAAITISQPTVREQVKAAGGGVVGLLAVCQSTIDHYESLLAECSVTVTEWLDPDGLAGLVRSAFVPDEAVAIADGRSEVSVSSSGPMAVAELWDRMRCDSAWHQVLEIAQWPTRSQKPGFMRWLNGGEFPHVVTQVIRPQGVQAGMKKVQDRMNDQQSAEIIRRSLGQAPKLEDIGFNSDLDRTGAEVLAGSGMARFTGLVVVSGASEEELEANARKMISGATRAGCELRPLYNQQWPGFLSAALPLGRALMGAK